MTTKSKEKKILIDLGNVRIREYDAMNLQIERLEETKNPKTQINSAKWKSKGYSGSIVSALQTILKNEWLIDKKAHMGLENYLEQVQKIYEQINKLVEGIE